MRLILVELGSSSVEHFMRSSSRSTLMEFPLGSTLTGKVEQIAPGDIEVVKWLRVAYHYELQFITKGRSILKYAGFRELNYEPVKSYLAETFGISLKKQDLAVKGWNRGSPLSFTRMTTRVSSCVRCAFGCRTVQTPR